jgi:hypothetical protein
VPLFLEVPLFFGGATFFGGAAFYFLDAPFFLVPNLVNATIAFLLAYEICTCCKK